MEQTVLSQAEIDSLLVAMDRGEFEEIIEETVELSEAKSYDFRRPARLSKEYISTISTVLEDFAKRTVIQLSGKLRQQVHMEMVSIEQFSFEEFINSTPKFTLVGTMSSKPQAGVQIIEVDSSISMQMVEILCGLDDVIDFKESPKKESFTDIELAILEEIIDIFAFSFQAVWQEITEVETKVDSITSNPHLLQSMPPNEPVILAAFNISINGHTSYVNLCIPYIFFEDILDKLSFRNWFHEGKETSDSDYKQFAKNIKLVPVELSALLGKSVISIKDFLEVETGDIIQLDTQTSEPLMMYIEDRSYFTVKPGSVEGRIAVEILEFIEGESSDE